MALALAAMLFAVPTAHGDEGGTTREIPLVMIVVGFDGAGNPDASVPYDDGYDWSAALFDEGESPAAYYRDMSGGAFTFTPAREGSASGVAGNTNGADLVDDGIVHVTLHRPHGAWGAVNADSSVTRDFGAVVNESLAAAAQFVDFEAYDADDDGFLAQQELAVCICTAGYEASSVTDFRRDDLPLLWAHAGLLSLIDTNLQMVGNLHFDSYIAIAERYWTEGEPLESAEREPLGIVYHELGHALGLPDLYAVYTTEGPWDFEEVGPLSLMDSGGWQYADDGGGWRNIPTSLDAWSRYVLGWSGPTLVTRSGDYTVSSQLSEAGYRPLIIPTSDPNEYFLVENRQPEGHDFALSPDYLGTGGLLVWHVDNEIYELHYDANTMNDVDHRPGVMADYAVNGELPLYAVGQNSPEALEGSGIVLHVAGEPSRDMTVHVELDDTSAARNALHLLDDAACEQLGMTRGRTLIEGVSWIMRSTLRAS